MMGVVDFLHQIGDGELQLMHPQPAGFGLRREPVARAEIEQDVGGLADHQPACLQERRREGRVRRPRRRISRIIAAQPPPSRRARHIAIFGAGLFQREADEFAAALDPGQ